jgi:uncharacterized membrane protein
VVAVADRGRGSGSGSLLEDLPLDELREQSRRLVSALAGRAVSGASDRVGGLVGRLGDIGNLTEQGGPGASAIGKAGKALAQGKSPVSAALSAGAEGIKAKASEAFGSNKSGKAGGKVKVTNIVEEIDVGAPVSVVYDTWTRFQDFSKFMKKVERVEQKDDNKLDFKAQILWSHRTWQATIVEQIPDKRIVWRSSGPKGHVDGAVTFHEIGPDLTRVLVVLEYHPQGLFERTGNLWRAQGRRVRLELKHFQRHVMTDTMLHPEDIEGWRGEIRDGEVVDEGEQDEDDYEDDYEDDEYDEDESAEDEDEDDEEDEYDEDEYEDEDEEAEDEADEDADDEYEYEDEEEDEEDEDDEEQARPTNSRRRSRSGRR